MLISQSGYDPYRVFFTSQPYLKAHPEIVAKFVRASVRGWRDYMADPNDVNTLLLRLNPAMTLDQMQFTWSALKSGHFIYPDDDPSKAGDLEAARWTEMYQQLSDLKVIQHPIDPATAYTTQFVESK